MTTRRQHLPTGTPQEPLAQRLLREMAEGLATHVGCCPLHGTRLICACCDVTMCGSAAEHLEMEALAKRSLATQGMTCRAWPCRRCGTQDIALCVDCHDAVADEAFAGLTPGEAERLQVLCQRSMRYTCLPAPRDDGPGR
jgi:hypothetical protein